MSDLVGVIQRVVDLLQQSDLKGLNTPIPIVNKTPNEVLDILDGLSDAAQELLDGFDPEVLLGKISILEEVQTQLSALPAVAEKIQSQITKLKDWQIQTTSFNSPYQA